MVVLPVVGFFATINYGDDFMPNRVIGYCIAVCMPAACELWYVIYSQERISRASQKIQEAQIKHLTVLKPDGYPHL